MRDRAIKQQLLTPAEEKALAQYVLRMAATGYSLPAKLLCSLAAIILRSAPPLRMARQHVRQFAAPEGTGRLGVRGFLGAHSKV